MARVQRHDDDAVGFGGCGAVGGAFGGVGGGGGRRCGWCGLRRGRACSHHRRKVQRQAASWAGCAGRGASGFAVVALCNEVAQRVGFGRRGRVSRRPAGWGGRGEGCGCRSSGGRRRGIAQSLGNQGLQRVDRGGWIQIENQPVAVGGDGRQGEHLRHRRLLEVYHQAHHARRVLAHPDARNVGVIGLDLGHQLAQLGAEVDALDVDRQARGGGHKKLFGHQRTIGFDGDPRIFGGGPYAHRHDGGATRNVLGAQQQNQGAGLQHGAAGGGKVGGFHAQNDSMNPACRSAPHRLRGFAKAGQEAGSQALSCSAVLIAVDVLLRHPLARMG